MNNFSFMSSLEENWLFRVKTPSEFSVREIADLAFLYMIALHILRSEFETAPQAIGYAKITNNHANYKPVDKSNTDLYQFLNILSDPKSKIAAELANSQANDILWHEIKFNTTTVRQFLNNVINKNYDTAAQRRLLFQLENQLHITTSNYRSMRRIAVEWDSNEIDTVGQKMVVTRLLQALRAKARRGDLLPWLEKLSSLRQYELFKVCDPESGEGCGTEPVLPTKTNNMSLLKSLALGALAGGIIGHAMGKNKR